MSKLKDTNIITLITIEEIEKRAKDVIAYSKENNHVGVISIFKNICLPFNKENYKKELFIKIFELSDIDYKWDENLGFIILSENRTKRTVVSHMDLIPTFNKGFSDNKTHEIKDNKIYGALDNTLTNAIVINSILNKQSKETSYLFTLDEETNQHAIRDYMKRFGKEQFIINLDITNEGYESNMSIEYDEPSWNICRQINDNLDNPFFTKDRECDDMDEVIKADGFGFSYCIPTKGNIHSYKNYTSVDKIKPYMDGLEYIIHNMDITSYIEDIDYIDIKKAIEYKTFEKFKENDKRPVYKRRESSVKGKSKIRGSKKYSISKDGKEFSDKFKEIIKKDCSNKSKFEKYVRNKIGYDGSFNIFEYRAIDSGIKLEVLEDNKLVYMEKENGSYKFKFKKSNIFKKKEEIKGYSEYSPKFIKLLKDSDENIQKSLEYIDNKIKYGESFSVNEYFQKFNYLDFAEMIEKKYIVSFSYGNNYNFNKKKIYSRKKIENKEGFFKLINLLTKEMSKSSILKMNNFIEKYKDSKYFKIEEFDSLLGEDAWLLYSIEGFEIFEYIEEDKYKFNYDFINSKLYKSWEMSEKMNGIDSLQLFMLFIENKKIGYADFVDLDKERDIKKTDFLITKLLSEKIISVDKKTGEFKIKK